MVKMDVKNKVMNEGLALKSLTSVPEEEVFVFVLMILTNTTM